MSYSSPNVFLLDCVFIVGSSHVFRQMYSQLQQSPQWEQLEAALYVMAAVGRNILPDEDTIVPGVLQQVLALPGNIHIAVRLTATKLVGELCEWIEKHPETLQATLNYLLQVSCSVNVVSCVTSRHVFSVYRSL